MVENKDFINPKLFGQQQYNENMIIFIKNLISKLEVEDSGTIIFSPTPNQAPKIANGLAELSNIGDTPPELKGLVEYIAESVHENYSLIECVEKGIGYHHGKMPSHIRIIIEKAFSKLLLKTLVCTTTLMQGVNLPAKNIISRNPNLYTQRRSGLENARLTGYEFANLRGRAGRLMKDFVGRAIILDEGAFDDAQIDLFENPTKEVTVGYGDRFNVDREEILENLVDGKEPSVDLLNNDILIYIRQMIIKYNEDSLNRMGKTGIMITQDEFVKIKDQLEKLEVPKEVCVKNWHWDPITLNEIYLANKKGIFRNMPKSPYDSYFVNTLISNILTLQQVAPYYYDRYLNIYGKSFDKRIYSLIINAQKWSCETSLKEIISWDSSIDKQEIDGIISDLNKNVMYSIPKLLKPLTQIQDGENDLLLYMEMGAFNPETRRLMEIGIPRETSIKLFEIMKNKKINVIIEEGVNDELLYKFLNDYLSELNYWEKVQVEDFII